MYMNKNILYLLGIFFSLSIGITSCSKDTQVADPYSDWAESSRWRKLVEDP